ncbi:hypothetical protein ACVWZK_005475 [Bradyrhizobium sp. GM0.4]
MVKKLTAEGAAREVIAAGQPVADIKITPTPDPRQAEPAKKPLPADLARALGQTEQ